MELEMEARAPSNAAFLSPPPGRLAAFGTWALSFIIPGLGMFTEAYFVFSVRTLRSLCAHKWVMHRTVRNKARSHEGILLHL